MKNKNDQKIPSARKDGLVIQRLESETLVYDTHQHRAHCLNKDAALIWGHCDGNRTVNDLARLLQAATGTESTGDAKSRDLVWVALGQLDESNLLESRIEMPAEMKGLTRRQLMKAAGIAALVAVPVVSSIVAPKAAQASTCLASGQTCGISAECCSGLCSGSVCV